MSQEHEFESRGNRRAGGSESVLRCGGFGRVDVGLEGQAGGAWDGREEGQAGGEGGAFGQESVYYGD